MCQYVGIQHTPMKTFTQNMLIINELFVAQPYFYPPYV
jgi:hypothetical protein